MRQAVDSVTKRDSETYMDMVRRAAGDGLGRLVKLTDNTHNPRWGTQRRSRQCRTGGT